MATSVANNTQSATATAAVTDLPGVYTYHNNQARDGTNNQEYALTKDKINATHFGKLTSCTVDGAIYAQPLWVANLKIGGAAHNVVFVATEHDGLFAFDADAVPCVKLWSVNLIDSGHGGTSGETTIPSATIGGASGVHDIDPEIGVTSTPVIDAATRTIYVVSVSVDGGHNYFQRLHAIDMATGSEKTGSPVVITGTFPGTGDGGTTVTFNPKQERQRAGLALVNGVVYIAWASYDDTAPFYGWIMGYQYGAAGFTRSSILNVAPNKGLSGIWMSGGAPAVDSNNNLYVLTANGTYDADSASAPNNDYGDSLLQLTPSLGVSQWFTPSDQLNDEQIDADFGAGGAAVLADLPVGSTVTHALICGGKDGTLFVINRDVLGYSASARGFGDSAALQKFGVGGGIFSTAAFSNSTLYISGYHTALQAWKWDTTTGRFAKTASSPHTFGFPGTTPSISSSANQNRIIWSLETTNFCQESTRCGPAVLYANDASDMTELWNSSSATSDSAGLAVKFMVPTIANGRVYVGTRGNDTGTPGVPQGSVPGELDIYGLKP